MVKVHTLDIALLRSETPPQKRSGMARVLNGSDSFTCTPTRSSAIGMSHTIPAFAFPAAAGTHLPITDPGGMAELILVRSPRFEPATSRFQFFYRPLTFFLTFEMYTSECVFVFLLYCFLLLLLLFIIYFYYLFLFSSLIWTIGLLQINDWLIEIRHSTTQPLAHPSAVANLVQTAPILMIMCWCVDAYVSARFALQSDALHLRVHTMLFSWRSVQYWILKSNKIKWRTFWWLACSLYWFLFLLLIWRDEYSWLVQCVIHECCTA